MEPTEQTESSEKKGCEIRSDKKAANKSKTFPYAQKIWRYGLSKYLHSIFLFHSVRAISPCVSVFCLFHVSAFQAAGCEEEWCPLVHTFFVPPMCFFFTCHSVGYFSMQFLLLPLMLPLQTTATATTVAVKTAAVFRTLYLLLSNFSDSNLQQSENCVNTRAKEEVTWKCTHHKKNERMK